MLWMKTFIYLYIVCRY